MKQETIITNQENSELSIQTSLTGLDSLENNLKINSIYSENDTIENSKEENIKKIFSVAKENITKTDEVKITNKILNEFRYLNLISQILIELQIIVFLYFRITKRLLALTIFSYILNFFPHNLKQRFWISLINLMIILINPSITLSTCLIYITALPQIFRLQKFKKIYIFFRPYRIIFGPIYGLILFWNLLLSSTHLTIISFLLYCVGVYFRPDFKEDGEEKYFSRRITHGYFMKLSFCTLIIRDLYDFINIYFKFVI
jgi:hypothetical protein